MTPLSKHQKALLALIANHGPILFEGCPMYFQPGPYINVAGVIWGSRKALEALEHKGYVIQLDDGHWIKTEGKST